MRTIVIIALLSIALPREVLSQDGAYDAAVDYLAKYHIDEGNLKEAEELCLNALTMTDEADNAYRNICNALSVVYNKLHNYQKAREYASLCKRLHEIYMDLYDGGYVSCLANCAMIENGMGHHNMAKLFMDVAIMYMPQNDEKFCRHILSNAVDIYYHAGFWDDAVQCITMAIAMSEKLGEHDALVYNNLAGLYLAKSKVEDALPYYEKAVSLCRTDYEMTEVLYNYALALWLSQSPECTKVAADASKMVTQGIATNFSFLSEKERYNYYKHFELDLPMLNLMLYESYDEGQFGHIYDNILTTKGLLLRTTNGVRDAILSSPDEQAKKDYGRLVALRQQISHERDPVRRTEINAEIEVLDKKLSRSAAAYGAFVKSNNIKWQDVHSILKENELAIEFYNIPIVYHCDTIQKMDAEPRYCAVVLKHGYEHPHIIPLCKESELEDLDIDLLYNDSLLYSLIWKPLEQELVNVENVYFAADRELHKIAIEYALRPEGDRMNDKYNLFRLSSTRVLAERHDQPSTNNAVLFGGLRYDLEAGQLIAKTHSNGSRAMKAARAAGLDNFRYGVAYLPGTKEEVEEIYKDYQSAKETHCRLITDVAGTEDTFKNLVGQDVGVIHLATHGFFWTEEEAERRSYVSFLANPMQQESYEDAALMRSGLFFSGANIGLAGEQLPDDIEDGILTAQELSSMNLGRVDMVVMSACQSGLGETSGEGVFGLQRGFKLAGANTLLMSLWKVDDSATCLLMTEFYKNYLDGESKHEALHHAQLKLRSDPETADPEFWAAFILLDALN